MKKGQRIKLIRAEAERLEKKGLPIYLSPSVLAKKMDVSEMTARRDLVELENFGVLLKVATGKYEIIPPYSETDAGEYEIETGN